MNEFWEKVEHYNAKLIPYALVALGAIIILEIFFTEFAEHYHLYLAIGDYLIIAIFVVDLTFLAIKAKSIKFFFKSYWLDILAVIPLAFMFTVASRIYRAITLAEEITIGQSILHESLELRKGVTVATRSEKFLKYIRIGARALRVVTKSRFFSEFKAKHHAARQGIKKKKYLRKKKSNHFLK
jgi:hypothetical protein